MKKLNIYLLLSSFGLLSLLTFVVSPISNMIFTNTIYENSILVPIFEILFEAVRIFAFSISYAIIIYSAYKFTLRKSTAQLFIFAGSILYYYLINFFITKLNTIFYFVLISVLLELLLHAIVLGIALAIEEKQNKKGISALKKTALCAAGVHIAKGVLEELSYDIQLGFPQTATEVFQAMLSYATDILVGVVIYAVMMFVFITFLSKETKKAV